MTLTDEQLKAVEAKVSENLVSAAAGSGKTKVLSERIVKRLTSGDTSIDRLLIVTFTRAAAVQMREKIGEALEEAYRNKPTDYLKRQMSLLVAADICTIDSFCIDLVRKNFFRVDVPPDFNVADENEMAILREEAVLEVLEEEYALGEEDFISLSHSVGKGKNDNALKEMILKVYSFTRAFADPDSWLSEAEKGHEKGSDKNEALFLAMGKELEEQVAELGNMISEARNAAYDTGVDAYAQVFESECVSFKNSFGADGKDFEKGFALFAFESFVGKKVPAELKEEKEYLKKLHDEAKSFYDKIKEFYFVYKSERGISYPKIKALIRCVKKFGEKYMAEKLIRKELEFSDCEYLALKALESSEEATEELRAKYDEIYIDEYQDTNPLQDELFSLVSRKAWGEPNLFIVGDVKQSIYRFRHSEPALFASKAKTFGKDDKSCKMVLSKNFRSREAVLNSINCVFEKIMRENTAGIEYDHEHRLKHGLPFIEYNKNKSEIYVLNTDDDEEDELKKEQKEAMVVASKIRQMMEDGFLVSDGGKMRRMEYSDVAVLSSSIKGKADMVSGIFNLMDIPCYCEASHSFFDTLEIRAVIALIKSVDNPLSDIPLASVMRSPIFSFDENELLEIRMDGRDKPFYENVEIKAEEESDLGKKCRNFIDKLSEWRNLSRVLSPERFISKITEESGYASFVGALPGGRARVENLKEFIRLAAAFEKNHYRGLYSFIRYVDKTIEQGGSADSGSTGEKNSVLVTTIHKSKGLEYPIVFVMGCGNRFNDKDATETLILSPSGGIGLVERDEARRIRFKTAEYRAVSMMITKDAHAEQMRLLYVAMTRAKEKLILVGTAKNYEKKSEEWEKYRLGRKMSDYTVRNITNYLDYVMGSADEAYWDINTVTSIPAIVEKGEEDEKTVTEYERDEAAIYSLSYKYPYDGVKSIPSKMSVSEIKKLSMDEENLEYYASLEGKRIPSFMKKEAVLRGANRGTAYHRVMELIDVNEKDVDSAVKSFVEKGLMTAAQADCIDSGKINAFLSSPLGEAMRTAKKVWKEVSFTMSIGARDVFDEGESEEIMVQGTIDCLIETGEGKLILLDYKTDFYKEPEEIGAKYKKQLDLYELAVFRRFCRKCDEKYLYLFHNDDIISV